MTLGDCNGKYEEGLNRCKVGSSDGTEVGSWDGVEDDTTDGCVVGNSVRVVC